MVATMSAVMPEKKKRNDAPVKIDAELLRKVRVIAGYEGKTLAEWITEALRPVVSRSLARITSELQKPDKP